MTIDDYQIAAMKTAQYGAGTKVNYPILGLLGEAGELANKYKKVLRDDNGVITETKKEDLIMELSDVLWYCAAIASDLEVGLDMVCQKNLTKLKDRRERGVIQGSGDNR